MSPTITANRNEQLIRSGYAAFQRGDLAAFNELFTPDISTQATPPPLQPVAKGKCCCHVLRPSIAANELITN